MFTPCAVGEVDARNASYSETWVDIPDLFSRNYNSRCIRTDMFGMGWEQISIPTSKSAETTWFECRVPAASNTNSP